MPGFTPLPATNSKVLAFENSHEKIHVPTAKQISDFDLSKISTTEYSKNVRPVLNSSSIKKIESISNIPLNNKLQNENRNSFRQYRQRLHINGPVLASSHELKEKINKNENLINDQIIFNNKHEQENEQNVLLPADLESKKNFIF